MKVTLEHYSPIEIALKAGLICTASENKIHSYNAENFIKKIIDMDHLSILEHIYYSFFVEDVSRALLQELSRHRHLSMSVQSTRWALNKLVNSDLDFIVLKLDSNYSEEQYAALSKLYSDINNIKNNIKEALDLGIKNDVLKYFIPEIVSTKLMLTLNARELRHIFKLRTSSRALKEFQNLCKVLYNSLPKEHKFLYSDIIDTDENI